MKPSRYYDVFLVHSWRYHDDWTKMCELLEGVEGFKWRNFSLPWHDPAMHPGTESGDQYISTFLESQIIPAEVVILLEGVFEIKSSRKWVEREIALARKHSKPIIVVPPWNKQECSAECASLGDQVVGWDRTAMIEAIKKFCAEKTNAMQARYESCSSTPIVEGSPSGTKLGEPAP